MNKKNFNLEEWQNYLVALQAYVIEPEAWLSQQGDVQTLDGSNPQPPRPPKPPTS